MRLAYLHEYVVAERRHMNGRGTRHLGKDEESSDVKYRFLTSILNEISNNGISWWNGYAQPTYYELYLTRCSFGHGHGD